MPIFFDEKSKVFKLDTATTSYAFRIGPHGYLLHLYYGNRVSDVDLPNLSFTVQQSSFSSYRSEETIRFSTDSARMEYACHGCGDYIGTALEIKRASGTPKSTLYANKSGVCGFKRYLEKYEAGLLAQKELERV